MKKSAVMMHKNLKNMYDCAMIRNVDIGIHSLEDA